MAADPARAVPKDPRPTVVEIAAGTGPVSADRPQGRRRRRLVLSFVLCVLLPVLAGAVYYATIASDRYVAGAGFAVRGMSGGGGLDGIGALTGLVGSGSTASDSYIVMKYLESRDLVEELEATLPLRAAFSDPGIDILSRAPADAPIEDFVDYWDRRVVTNYDSGSGVLTFTVEAFTAEDARDIAAGVLVATRALVNRLSEDARRDAVRFAEDEVARAETRLREALDALRTFREDERSLNPAASAQLDIELLGDLESRLVDLRARMAALGGDIDPDAPSLIRLRRAAAALETQIAELSQGTGAQTGRGAITGQLAAYEALEVEKSFAEKTYASALASLQQARIDADRQQRYLAVYSEPALPQHPLYPRRAINVLILAAVATALWGVGTLIVYSVRDHLS